MVEISYFKAWIKAITTMGEVTIAFNERINDFNMSQMNTSNTLMYVYVTEERMMETNFNASALNFTWKMIGFAKHS